MKIIKPDDDDDEEENHSTMSHSPPLEQLNQIPSKASRVKIPTTEEQMVSDPSTQSQQAPLMKPNPYSRLSHAKK